MSDLKSKAEALLSRACPHFSPPAVGYVPMKHICTLCILAAMEDVRREGHDAGVQDAYDAAKRAFVNPAIHAVHGRMETDVPPAAMVRIKGAIRALKGAPR